MDRRAGACKGDIRNSLGKLNDPGKPAPRRLVILPRQLRTVLFSTPSRSRRRLGAIHFSQVSESRQPRPIPRKWLNPSPPASGWPHPLPPHPLPPAWTSPRPCRGPGAGLGSRRQGTWRLNSHDNHALGTAHAFAHVAPKTDLANRRASSERLHSGRGGVAESEIPPLLRDQGRAGQFGPRARTCERYHGLFSPGSRPTASSQTLSASPTGLRARWACGLMVLGTTKCFHETRGGRFSSASRSPWSLRRAKWSLRRAKWPSGRIGLPMATSLSYPSD